jgi:hypothetical protein
LRYAISATGKFHHRYVLRMGIERYTTPPKEADTHRPLNNNLKLKGMEIAPEPTH